MIKLMIFEYPGILPADFTPFNTHKQHKQRLQYVIVTHTPQQTHDKT